RRSGGGAWSSRPSDGAADCRTPRPAAARRAGSHADGRLSHLESNGLSVRGRRRFRSTRGSANLLSKRTKRNEERHPRKEETGDKPDLISVLGQEVMTALERLVDGTICVHCGADAAQFRQVRRSYYADPCGC